MDTSLIPVNDINEVGDILIVDGKIAPSWR